MGTRTTSDLQIRLATDADAEVILELWQNSAKWLLSNGIVQWSPEHFKVDQDLEFLSNGSHVYVAQIENVIVGTYILTWADPLIWVELDSEEAGYIHRFAVNRSYRGRGIGQRLIRAAEEQIRQHGKSIIRLDCMAANQRLLSLFLFCCCCRFAVCC